MGRTIVGIIAILATTIMGCSKVSGNKAVKQDPKYIEVSSIPIGLKVSHSPTRAKAQPGGPSGRRYIWVYQTTVESVDVPVTISEFGCFYWHGERWTLGNSKRTPFTSADFADWYSCPASRILVGRTYVDPRNWGGNEQLVSAKALWYFVGVTDAGEKVRGEAVVEQLGELAGSTVKVH